MASRMSNRLPPDNYLVQIGFAGDCFTAIYPSPVSAPEIPSQAKVLVRTPRGVELGTVLRQLSPPVLAPVPQAADAAMNPASIPAADSETETQPETRTDTLADSLTAPMPDSLVDAPTAPTAALTIIRRVTRDDQLLIDRLNQHKTKAVRRCQDVLARQSSEAVLLDVDQLFDGNTLVLHFLGPVDALGRELTDEMVKQYESEVQSIRLSELMSEGCGPGCGTPAAEGGGCGTGGGCATCAAGSCGTRSRS